MYNACACDSTNLVHVHKFGMLFRGHSHVCMLHENILNSFVLGNENMVNRLCCYGNC